MSYQNYKDKGFTLLEAMVAIAVFALIVTVAGGIFVHLQQSWRRQKNSIELVQNARWALEFMANEIRRASVSPGWAQLRTLAGGQRLRFGLDLNGDCNPDPTDLRIEYRRNGEILRMRWRQAAGGGGWQPWQELANFIVDNPDLVNNSTGFPPGGDGDDPLFILNSSGLLTIELTVRPIPAQAEGIGNRNYTLRTQVRPRN